MLATTRATSLKVFKAHHFLAAGLAALALTAVAAAGTLQMSGDSSAGPAAMAPRAAVGATAEREATYTFYMVSSPAQAAAAMALNDEAARIRIDDGDFGPPDVVAYVEVVNDEASLNRVMRQFRDLNDIRLGAGLPEPTLVDLRGLGR